MSCATSLASNRAFLSFPGEIRNLIYEFYFSNDEGTVYNDYELPEFFNMTCTTMFLLNKQIYTESRPYFLKTFLPKMFINFLSPSSARGVARIVPPDLWGSIKGQIKLSWSWHVEDPFVMLNAVAQDMGFRSLIDLESLTSGAHVLKVLFDGTNEWYHWSIRGGDPSQLQFEWVYWSSETDQLNCVGRFTGALGTLKCFPDLADLYEEAVEVSAALLLGLDISTGKVSN